MPMPCLETDLGAVFASSDFGEAGGTVTWKGLPISGVIFDDEDLEIQLGEGIAEIGHRAILTGPSASFAGIADEDPVVVRGNAFKVKNWIDDGTGVIEIHLERQ